MNMVNLIDNFWVHPLQQTTQQYKSDLQTTSNTVGVNQLQSCFNQFRISPGPLWGIINPQHQAKIWWGWQQRPILCLCVYIYIYGWWFHRPWKKCIIHCKLPSNIWVKQKQLCETTTHDDSIYKDIYIYNYIIFKYIYNIYIYKQ